jgi:ElaB/YqjD/DUF883 family membrane-anchored ribosome-binding protein
MDTNREHGMRGGMGEQVGRTADRMTEQAGRMGEQVAEQAGRVTDIAAARAKGLVTSAREGAQQAADYVQDAVQPIRDKVVEYTEGGFERVREDVVSYTRQQPMNALLVAAGVGLIIGWLTSLGRR